MFSSHLNAPWNQAYSNQSVHQLYIWLVYTVISNQILMKQCYISYYILLTRFELHSGTYFILVSIYHCLCAWILLLAWRWINIKILKDNKIFDIYSPRIVHTRNSLPRAGFVFKTCARSLKMHLHHCNFPQVLARDNHGMYTWSM